MRVRGCRVVALQLCFADVVERSCSGPDDVRRAVARAQVKMGKKEEGRVSGRREVVVSMQLSRKRKVGRARGQDGREVQ